MKSSSLLLFLCATLCFTSCSSVKNGEINPEISPEKDNPTISNNNNMEENQTKVLFETTLGNFTIALYNETPLHRDNFIKLVNDKFYDGILFHRIIQGFMVQTGDPDSKTAQAGQPLGQGGPGYTIPAEFVPSLYHKRGAVAAARMGDQMNPTKASSGSQFYIVDGTTFPMSDLNALEWRTGKQMTEEQKNTYSTKGGAPHLDGAYTVFGEVISGMHIIDKIASQSKDGRDRPYTDIAIISAKIVQ